MNRRGFLGFLGGWFGGAAAAKLPTPEPVKPEVPTMTQEELMRRATTNTIVADGWMATFSYQRLPPMTPNEVRALEGKPSMPEK